MPSLAFFICLSALGLYDWRYFRLPNLLTFTLAVSGLMAPWFMPSADSRTHLIGGVAGLALFPLINLGYRRLRKRNGVGFGDAKLLAGIGLWLGWPALPYVLLLASLTGLGFAILAHKPAAQALGSVRLPFGSFLCLAAWLIWVHGPIY
ncbi:prepilin peptidase [Kordiimonas marina]|uniref:prepilin peptidase n=1 Tax=Kordiimonas marina TaxID=2872312 RepID=UPI001FF2D850|nr:A24 family peptidase [Kordiimonas marina]MCJ9430043.1 A24 family peptidase [Kordiimonas marina]